MAVLFRRFAQSFVCAACRPGGEHQNDAVWSPMMSRTSPRRTDRVESLKFSCRCGFSPNARQMRTMAFCALPLVFAIERVLQWVAPAGFFSKVRVATASILGTVIFLGCPASPRPPSRSVAWPTSQASPLRPRSTPTPPSVVQGASCTRSG